jgi:hypothetical protein
MPPKSKTTATEAPAEPEPIDHSMADAAIEAELNRHRIGTFRVLYKDMTFKWKDRDNRALTSGERLSTLIKSMRNGLYRSDISHRMSGIIARDQLTGKILSPDDPRTKVKQEDVRKFNERAQFPVVAFPGKSPKVIEMQSGQHRMGVLQTLFPQKQEQWWWIVTLYDDGMTAFLWSQ